VVKPVSRCVPATQELMTALDRGFKPREDFVFRVAGAFTVESRDYDPPVYFVAAIVGDGSPPQMRRVSMGTWATESLDGKGDIYSVDVYTQIDSTYPRFAAIAPKPDAFDGTRAALDCALDEFARHNEMNYLYTGTMVASPAPRPAASDG